MLHQNLLETITRALEIVPPEYCPISPREVETVLLLPLLLLPRNQPTNLPILVVRANQAIPTEQGQPYRMLSTLNQVP